MLWLCPQHVSATPVPLFACLIFSLMCKQQKATWNQISDIYDILMWFSIIYDLCLDPQIWYILLWGVVFACENAIIWNYYCVCVLFQRLHQCDGTNLMSHMLNWVWRVRQKDQIWKENQNWVLSMTVCKHSQRVITGIQSGVNGKSFIEM